MSLDRSLHLHGSGPDTVLDAQESWMFRDTVGELELTLEDATVRGLSVPENKGAFFHSSGDSGAVALRRVSVDGLEAHNSVVIGGLVQTVGASVEMSELRVSDVSIVASDGLWGLLAYIGNGGDLLVQDVQLIGGSVTGDYVGTFYAGNPGSLVVEGLEVAELGIAPVYTAYSLGLYYAGEANEMRVEDLTVRDNTLRYSMNVHTQMYGGLGLTANHYGEAPIEVKRLSVLRNTVQSAGGFTVRGGVVSVGSGTMTVDNAVVAGNLFESADGGTLQGLVGEAYYSDVTWTNADIALNTAKGFELVQGGAFIAGSDNRYAFVNVSVVDNDLSDNDQVLATTWYSYYDSELSWDYSNVHGNLPEATPHFYEDFHAMSVDTLELDPLYLEPEALDLSLREDSPLIDAGDPAILDADGSTSDIGAFGGPEAW